MTPETTYTFIVNAYWMIGIVIGGFAALLGIIWMGKKEIYEVIEKSLQPLREQMMQITEHIANHAKDIGHLQGQYGVSHSPMTPNEKGESLLKESGFYEIYPAIKDRIFHLLDDMSPRTLYDAEQGARTALEKLKSDSSMDKVKDYVINHPKEPLELIFMIASWNIRDEYWGSKNKG